MAGDGVTDSTQHPTPFSRMEFSPGPIAVGKPRGGNGPVNILSITVREFRPHFTRCWILAFKITPGAGVVPGIRRKILIALHVLKVPSLQQGRSCYEN